SQLHFILRHYKSGVYREREALLSVQVASLLSHFVAQHRKCIAAAAGEDWELITSVPSTSRPGEHPLVSALPPVPDVFATHDRLLRRGSGAIGHNKAAHEGYVVLRTVAGERGRLVDDPFPTGAPAP